MKPWNRLLAILRMKPGPDRRLFALDGSLQAALAERADRERLPLEQLQTELLRAGLAHEQTVDRLKLGWERLSQREREVTALTCLGYTNRQMAAHMQLSSDTVKGYVRQAQVKWQVHGKNELRLLLAEWDFSDWGLPAP